MNLSTSRILVLSCMITLIIGIGCTATKKTTSAVEDQVARDSAALEQSMTELQNMLADNRSKLTDLYTSQQHDMPETYLSVDSSDQSLNSDPFDGYRVQIISTRDVQLADSMKNKFLSWSDSTIKGYSADAYVFFKQPFYKVHIGDFQQRSQANSFSKLIKQKYPDAWVVHDRINPTNTPADTASFSIITPAERKEKKNKSRSGGTKPATDSLSN